jgi:hypothetical protein
MNIIQKQKTEDRGQKSDKKIVSLLKQARELLLKENEISVEVRCVLYQINAIVDGKDRKESRQ